MRLKAEAVRRRPSRHLVRLRHVKFDRRFPDGSKARKGFNGSSGL